MHRPCLLVFLLAVLLPGCVTTHPAAEPGAARAEHCLSASEHDIAALFEAWNRSLQSGDAKQVVARYAEASILLPTLSNQPRQTAAEKLDYFRHFLHDRPSGRITFRTIQVGCNSALDAGLYTFTFAATGARVEARYSFTYRWTGREWLITSHHSSLLPESH